MLALGMSLDAADAASEEVCTPLSRPLHRDACALLKDWREQEARGGFIVGIHVPSRPLSRLLHGLSLYEPIDDARDFRVRLAGSLLLRRFGRDVTGMRLSELFRDRQFAFHHARMKGVHTSGHPFMLDIRLMRDGLSRQHFELLAVQVFSPDCRLPWIMTGQFIHRD